MPESTRPLRLMLILAMILISGCVRWAIENDLESWQCTDTECRAQVWLENPYEAKIVVTTWVVAYQEVGLQRDTGAPYTTGGFEESADSEDLEVGRTEAQYILEPGEAKQLVETVKVSLRPDKLVLIVSEARSITD